MEKMSFSDFIKYARAYEQYLASAAPAAPATPPVPAAPATPPAAPATPPAAPATPPVPAAPAAPAEVNWQTIETSLAEILKRMDAAPKPSVSDVNPETVDDVIKKILI